MVRKKPLPYSTAMAETAGGRAKLYDLFVGVFGRLPDKNLIVQIRSRGLQNLLDSCYGVDNSGFRAGVDYVKSYQANTEFKSDEEILTDLSVDRTRILRATGGVHLRPPYEGLYKNNKRTGASALEVKSFYRKAGLLPDETVCELPDFLCVELDFMKNLCRREQEQRSSAIDVSETVATEEKFLREHLGSWVGEFCSQAEKHALTDFYRGFLAILDAVVSIDMEYLNNLLQTEP